MTVEEFVRLGLVRRAVMGEDLPVTDELAYLTPEAKARVEIDRMLAAAGWAVQDAQRGEPRRRRAASRCASS